MNLLKCQMCGYMSTEGILHNGIYYVCEDCDEDDEN